MQSNVKMYVLVSSVLVTFFSVTEAWLTTYDVTGQVDFECIKSGEECTHSSLCCSKNDACLMDPKQSFIEGRKVGFCTDMELMKNSFPPTQFEGERCEDSSECIVGCCVSIRRHRYGILQVCARDVGPFMCISSMKGLNDIFKK